MADIEVVGHYCMRGFISKFRLRTPSGMEYLIRELNMDKAVYPRLMAYKNRISGCHWDGTPGVFPVERILGHRMYSGMVAYHVQWAGEFTHPIWDSEVMENDMVDLFSAPTKECTTSDRAAQYKCHHRLLNYNAYGIPI